MCGICGIINFDSQSVREDDIRQMMLQMKHRGPNDEGIFLNGTNGFGFVRLSILDLSDRGHQPMFDITQRFMIVHNGEVYNYIELREELIKLGYTFRSNTDTEVILYSYLHWGQDCLHKFNGMWAFAVYDKLENTLFISRDRFGIKPFYYYLDEHRFIFASDIPPILTIIKNKKEPNYQSIFDFLVFNRTDYSENTFFEKVKKLQHGHLLKTSCDPKSIENFKISRWYNLRERVCAAEPFSSPEEYREFFSSSINLRLRSDVPVGACLSGGLDSSSIVSVLLNDFKRSDINSFSAVYGKNVIGDEKKYIDEYSQSINNMYFIYPNADTLLKDLDRFIFAHSEPMGSTSPYAQFKVMELAKNNNAVVMLDGQGADEQLAGYHYFFGFYFKELAKTVKLCFTFQRKRKIFSKT